MVSAARRKMTSYQAAYQSMGDSVLDDDTIMLNAEDDAPPPTTILQFPEHNKDRWSHIEDLDEFFSRIYQYHQRSGIVCILIQDILQLVQFAFVPLFSIFLFTCIDYSKLFSDNNTYEKVTIADAIYPVNSWSSRLTNLAKFALILATFIFVYRLLKFIYMVFKYFEMYAFYSYALNISTDDLQNMTWHEVQQRLQTIQKEHQMCVHKQQFTQLDIYHRILRFKNYMIALVNKSVLPLTFHIPFIGKYDFLSSGLKFNIEFILFLGPSSPFENNWHLKSEFKDYGNRMNLASHLSRYILLVGLANILFSPIIFCWHIIYNFFRYTEIVKREPGMLGSRRWSHYARQYTRHFNELDHEFNSRLSRAYKPAKRYMDIFISPLLAIVSKYITFFVGSLLSVLIIFTVIDEDFLAVKNVLAIISILTVIISVSNSCIPDEYCIWCPEMLLRAVLAQIHYLPVEWRGLAHKINVRNQFSSLFQYKVVYLLEELISPLVTPIVLLFWMRPRALEIVDFFCQYTVNVDGVGDVCSFALMDIKKHGNAEWLIKTETNSNQRDQAEFGKTELSLVHFTLTNPEWKPPNNCVDFMENIKEQVTQDAHNINMANVDNALFSSLGSLANLNGDINGYNSMMSSIQQASVMQTHILNSGDNPSCSNNSTRFMGQSSSNPTTTTTTGSTTTTGTTTTSTAPPPPSVGVTSPVSMNHTYALRGNLRNIEGPSMNSIAGLRNLNSGILSSANKTLESTGHSLCLSQSMSGLGSGVGGGVGGVGGVNGCRHYTEDALELMSTEMSFSALYLHDRHRWRNHNSDASSSTSPHLQPHHQPHQQPHHHVSNLAHLSTPPQQLLLANIDEDQTQNQPLIDA